jgi:hypothetical protein
MALKFITIRNTYILMGIVRENINFERGLDPKRSMDIGMSRKKAHRKLLKGLVKKHNLQ